MVLRAQGSALPEFGPAPLKAHQHGVRSQPALTLITELRRMRHWVAVAVNRVTLQIPVQNPAQAAPVAAATNPTTRRSP